MVTTSSCTGQPDQVGADRQRPRRIHHPDADALLGEPFADLHRETGELSPADDQDARVAVLESTSTSPSVHGRQAAG